MLSLLVVCYVVLHDSTTEIWWSFLQMNSSHLDCGRDAEGNIETCSWHDRLIVWSQSLDTTQTWCISLCSIVTRYKQRLVRLEINVSYVGVCADSK